MQLGLARKTLYDSMKRHGLDKARLTRTEYPPARPSGADPVVSKLSG